MKRPAGWAWRLPVLAKFYGWSHADMMAMTWTWLNFYLDEAARLARKKGG